MREHSQQIEIVWEERFPDLRPGVLYFECERLSAHLTHDSCHQNWTAAHEKVTEDTPLRLMKCRGCLVGRALHTDADDPQTWQDIRSSSECVRCGRRDLRIISTTQTCVSCWNRQRETERGRDARGNDPKTKTVLYARRVGVVDADGNATWRRFDALHEGESVSKAIRQIDGAQFHSQQPGKVVFNARTKEFQYRCTRHGGELSSLVERHCNDGSIQYVCPVCTPKSAKGLPEARVCGATSLSSAEFVRESLMFRGVGCELTEHWTPTAHVCDRCRHYAIEARLRSGRVETRCPMCDGE